ncbi:Phytoene desaturase [Neolecta irregularis DAH-3]|uniref:Phytoene desaturase n=1 Tax=Neolecta irregularis (strain DAH-3) TaxID=1198029 RepID=A0A1U7LHF3_NEOID|nr:Phytoene desaturase [Neolecta irregularis DAH-3]|eukprot:OLL22074.1 Phytoene desaturase [Neolecta irregularis DAH-3]
MYLGMSPFEAPATYNLLQYAELVQGIYYPIGGFHKIPESFEAIAKKHGAKVVYEAPVARILLSGNRATGVRLESGEEIYADITICNADAVWAYNHLLPPTTFAKNLEKKNLTSSSISFYWCVDRVIEELDVHNIFLADRYRESFDEIFKNHDLPRDLSFYVNVPSRIDPSAAPKGKDAIVVLVPVGYITDQDWDCLVARARKAVLIRLAIHLGYDIERFIVEEDVSDPRRWRADFNLHAGSILGLSHEISQVLFFRPNTKSRQFQDLYFVGASVQPGTGVPIVISGAKIVSEEILRNLKMHIPWKKQEEQSMNFATIFAIIAALWSWALNLFTRKPKAKKL